MRQIFLLPIAIILVLNVINAQENKKALDLKAIKSMAGCYNIDFKYTETFAPEVDYEHAYDYNASAFEWAEIVEETEDKVVLQHLLIIQDTAMSYIIKHWRQDWLYESDKQFRYDKDNHWVFEPLDSLGSKGKWTQNVYQVDDSPRYSGTATWVHVDGYSSWYNKADSPLPRREYSKRSDYNLMKRGNRVQTTDYGWLHEQDNDKVIRTDSTETLLVQEKGYNIYKKRDDEDCKLAQDWWVENHGMWDEVRTVWDGIYWDREDIQLHRKVDDKMIYEHLFFSAEDKEWTTEELKALFEQYIVESEEE